MIVNSPPYVLDSFALLAYLNNEFGTEHILNVFQEAAQGYFRVVLPLINLGEVLYITEREVSLSQAQAVLAAIEQLPLEILPATRDAVLAAAHIKANFPVAYADAFVIAAALELSGTVLTGDPEFHAVEEVIAVEWLVAND